MSRFLQGSGNALPFIMRLLVFTVASSGVSAAETRGLGYGIVGPTVVSGFFGGSGVHASGGGDLLIVPRVGLGGELGLLAGGGALHVLSLCGSFHFAKNRAPQNSVPFISAGYTTMGNADGSFRAWNLGGGVHYWAARRVGIRAEVRDHVRPDSRGTVHYLSVRVGVAFR